MAVAVATAAVWKGYMQNQPAADMKVGVGIPERLRRKREKDRS